MSLALFDLEFRSTYLRCGIVTSDALRYHIRGILVWYAYLWRLDLKSNHDQVRLPAYMRHAHGESSSNKEMSVGDVLRVARKALIIRQIVFFFLFLAIVAAVISLFAFGLFEDAWKLFTDRFLNS
ncbi:MAG: hypothetical protein JW780_00055 [Clostridiales bacterium]|nr:hypothetical protein [Clostridiales bacterium]